MLRRMQTHDALRVSRPIVAVLAQASRLSVVLLVACVGYSIYAFSEMAVERTRISENALLPGLVDDAFADTSAINRHFSRLRERANDRRCGLTITTFMLFMRWYFLILSIFSTVAEPKQNVLLRAVLNYIHDELSALRIETHRQTFATRPTILTLANSSTTHGENMFGIVRAPRSPPFESILVVVGVERTRLASAAYALALAAYAKQQIYWARDLVFLFVDGHNVAAEAWLSAFYGVAHPHVDADELAGRAGPIIGAFVLDVRGGVDVFRAVNIQYGMVNGRLPNLDLVNLFVLLVKKYGVLPTIHNIAHSADYNHVAALALFTRAVVLQSFLETEGLHSILGSYGINALTLQAAERIAQLTADGDASGEPHFGGRSPASDALSAVELARVFEGGMRSLNNILEKFHQSYFLYFLAHPNRFVSVAFYMPIIGLLLVPMLLFALRDWLRFKYGDAIFDVPSPADNSKANGKTPPPVNNVLVERKAVDVIGGAFSILLTHAISVAFYALIVALYSLRVVWLLRSVAGQSTPAAAASEWLSTPTNVFTLLLVLPWTIHLPLALYVGRVRNISHYYTLRFATACEISLLFGALSLLNFSLAFALAVLLVPFATFTLATDRKSSAFLKLFGFGLLNPFTIAASLAVVMESHGIVTFGGISAFNMEAETARAVWNRLVRWAALVARNHFIHGSALFPILIIVFLPTFHSLLQILVYESHEDDIVSEEKTAESHGPLEKFADPSTKND